MWLDFLSLNQQKHDCFYAISSKTYSIKPHSDQAQGSLTVKKRHFHYGLTYMAKLVIAADLAYLQEHAKK